MIRLSKINDKPFFMNEQLIEVMEETPDTKITLTNGHTYIVRESCEEIVEQIFASKNRMHIRRRSAQEE